MELTEDMGRLQAPIVTSPEDLELQLQHPTAEAICARAVEVFGDEARARSWLTSSREISPDTLLRKSSPLPTLRSCGAYLRF
jgi:hypothetical protein